MIIRTYLIVAIAFFCLHTESHAQALAKKDGMASPLDYALGVPFDYFGYVKEAVKKDSLYDYLMGAGVIGASMLLDDPIRNYFRKEHPLSDVESIGNLYLHYGGIYDALYGGLFLSGYLLDRQSLSDTAVMGVEKLILDMNICGLLKNNVDRRRPNGSNNQSFTSGHTTPPASFASTVSIMSNWNPWVTGISYSISIFTGLCRIETDQHWFSDVIASHVFTLLTAIPMSQVLEI
jgi:hypothetical protein